MKTVSLVYLLSLLLWVYPTVAVSCQTSLTGLGCESCLQLPVFTRTLDTMCEPAVARQLGCACACHATLVRSLYTLLCMLLREPIVAWEASVQCCYGPCSSCAWLVMLWRLSVAFASVFGGNRDHLGVMLGTSMTLILQYAQACYAVLVQIPHTSFCTLQRLIARELSAQYLSDVGLCTGM